MHDFRLKWLHTSLISHIRFPFYDSLREYSMRERAIFIFSRILNNRTKKFIPFLVLFSNNHLYQTISSFFFSYFDITINKSGKTSNNEQCPHFLKILISLFFVSFYSNTKNSEIIFFFASFFPSLKFFLFYIMLIIIESYKVYKVNRNNNHLKIFKNWVKKKLQIENK